MWPDLPLFPEAASEVARQVDALYLTWVAISAFFSLLIFALIAFFFIHFRRRRQGEIGDLAEARTLPLELTWSLIPLVIVLAMAFWGMKVFFVAWRAPADAVEYWVTAKQWMWKVQHPTGVREINTLHVPVGQAVKLTMTSEDTIHDFYVPAFRVKMDVLPGRYTSVWFRADRPGTYHLFCAEYCGTEHSLMRGSVVVLPVEEYERWLATGRVGPTMQATGAELFTQLACDTCHRTDVTSPDAMPARAPALEGLFGSRVALQSGRTVIADETYIRTSILDPHAEIVAGWQPIMPTFKGQVTEEQLNALVAYIKSLEPGAANGVADLPPTNSGVVPEDAVSGVDDEGAR